MQLFLYRAGGRCPIDGKAIDRDKVFVDKPLQKRIQALRVKCSFHENGCAWQGQLRELPVCRLMNRLLKTFLYRRTFKSASLP